MLRLVRIAQMTVRLAGLLLIVLGVLIWTGNQRLVSAHMALGLLFVLALWSLAGLGFRARVGSGLGLRAVVWGMVVLWLGMIQQQMWPGSRHTYVRVLHLVVGLVAIGVAEMLAARIKRRWESGGAAQQT